MPSPFFVSASIGSSLAVGILPVLLSTVSPALQKQSALSDLQVRRMGQWHWLAWFLSFPIAGWLVDQWSIHDVLFTGLLLLALAISWIALSQTYSALVWGAVGMSLAGAWVMTSAISLMPQALAFSPRQSLGAALSLGLVFAGLAALLAPAALPRLIDRFGCRPTLLAIGLLCLVPALLIAISARSEDTAGPPSRPLNESFEDIRLWLIALAIFLYFPLERLLEIWPRPYLGEIGYAGGAVTRLLVGFWAAFLIMRFAL